MKAPSFSTIGNFIRENLTNTIEDIFVEINKVIFEKENVDMENNRRKKLDTINLNTITISLQQLLLIEI